MRSKRLILHAAAVAALFTLVGATPLFAQGPARRRAIARDRIEDVRDRREDRRDRREDVLDRREDVRDRLEDRRDRREDIRDRLEDRRDRRFRGKPGN